MKFKTSFGVEVKIITALITILFATIIGMQISAIQKEGSIIYFFTIALLVLIYVWAFVFKVRYYEVTPNGIIIKRIIGDVKIARSLIANVEPLKESTAFWAIRVFGNGGFFGYYGKFLNHKLGITTRYATRKDKLVIIFKTNGEKIIVSPDEPKMFVEEFNKSIE